MISLQDICIEVLINNSENYSPFLKGLPRNILSKINHNLLQKHPHHYVDHYTNFSHYWPLQQFYLDLCMSDYNHIILMALQKSSIMEFIIVCHHDDSDMRQCEIQKNFFQLLHDITNSPSHLINTIPYHNKPIKIVLHTEVIFNHEIILNDAINLLTIFRASKMIQLCLKKITYQYIDFTSKLLSLIPLNHLSSVSYELLGTHLPKCANDIEYILLALNQCVNLQHITLPMITNNVIHSPIFSTFLSHHKFLHTLRFCDNSIPSRILQIFIKNVCSFIKELVISNVSIDVDVMKALYLSPYFKKIKKLELTMCLECDDAFFMIINFLLSIRNTLTYFFLFNNFLTVEQHMTLYKSAYVEFQCIRQIVVSDPFNGTQMFEIQDKCKALCT